MTKASKVVDQLRQFLSTMMPAGGSSFLQLEEAGGAGDELRRVWHDAHAALRGTAGAAEPAVAVPETKSAAEVKAAADSVLNMGVPAFTPEALSATLRKLEEHVKATEATQAARHDANTRRHEGLKGVLQAQQKFHSEAVVKLTNRLLNAEQARRDANKEIEDQKNNEKAIKGRQGTLLEGVKDSFQGTYMQCHMLKEAYDLRKINREENADRAREVRVPVVVCGGVCVCSRDCVCERERERVCLCACAYVWRKTFSRWLCGCAVSCS
jgi:hypothetical protein